jgi:hypothetical protein
MDGWFTAHDRPPRELTEALMMETEDISSEDAWALIDARPRQGAGPVLTGRRRHAGLGLHSDRAGQPPHRRQLRAAAPQPSMNFRAASGAVPPRWYAT